MSELLEHENLQEEEEVGPDQALTLRQIFGEKLMDVGSMDRMIRWVTGLGIAQILFAVMLIGLNLISMPTITLTDSQGEAYQLAIPIIVACVIFMATAWTWLFVGALHSRLLIRIPILCLFYGLHYTLLLMHGSTVTGWLVLALSLCYALWHGRTRPQGYVRDMLVIGLGIAFAYLAMVDQYRFSNPGQQFIVLLVSSQVMTLTILLVPMFMFAGLDLGESVRDMARWLIGQGAARSNERLLFWAALAVGLVKLVWLVTGSAPGWGWVAAGLIWIGIGYFTVRMKPWHGLHHEPQFLLVFALTVSSFLLLLAMAVAPAFLGAKVNIDTIVWWVSGLIGASGAVAAVVLVRGQATVGRRTAAAFLMILALWALVRVAGAFASLGMLGATWQVSVDLESLDGSLSVLLPLLLAYLGWKGLATRSVAAWAISLTIGVSVIRGMIWLVQNNFDIPAAAAFGQLAVMAVGLLWDVMTSGDRWTNGDSSRVPRFARVLLYFGYVSLSVTAILFNKGSGFNSFFDEDSLAISGLLVMGIPIYLYGFARSGVMLVRQAWERKHSPA